jgi:hypothetical protein
MKRAISVRARAGGMRDRGAAQGATADAHAMRPSQVARENLIALGVCIGKFTHSNKFILTIGALDLLAQHAKYKARIARSLLLLSLALQRLRPRM